MRLSTVMRLKPFLPSGVWQRMRNSYWRGHWEAEARRPDRYKDGDGATLSGSERATLVEAVADEFPFSNLLEVGCAFGQNFHQLAPIFPHARLVGIDRDEAAIHSGQEYLKEQGIQNTTLIAGYAQNLSFLPDRSFDIVLSCAFFLYVPPEQVESILGEMLRVTGRTLFLLEQHDESLAADTFVPRDGNLSGYWLRNYTQLVRKLAPDHRLTVTGVPTPLWRAERWIELGHLITVRTSS